MPPPRALELATRTEKAIHGITSQQIRIETIALFIHLAFNEGEAGVTELFAALERLVAATEENFGKGFPGDDLVRAIDAAMAALTKVKDVRQMEHPEEGHDG